MKDTEKQEMAEWFHGEFFNNKHTGIGGPSPEWIKWFYSPDGFFAVWDKVLAQGYHEIIIGGGLDDNTDPWWKCELYEHIGDGKDRYEAFYKAVREAWGK